MSSKGFALPELLISVVITLCFAILGLTLFYVNGQLINEANRNLSVAVSHAQFAMEDIKNSNFATLKTDIANGNWNWNSTVINAAGLTALKNETIHTSSTGTNPLDITVTVSWQDRTLQNRTFVLETLIGG